MFFMSISFLQGNFFLEYSFLAIINGNLISFNNQDAIDQFDRFVYFMPGFSFWTPGYSNTSAAAWFWSQDTPIDPTLFCDYQQNKTIPASTTNYVANKIYCDGSGCLKAGQLTVIRYPAFVGFDYHNLINPFPLPSPGPSCID